MSMIRGMLVAAGVFLLSSIPAEALTPAEPQAKIGEKAPSFKLTDTKGKEHSLSDFTGKYVVLEWFNHQCPFVKKHYKSGNMQALQKKYMDKGVVWLSINSSAVGKQGSVTSEQAEAVLKEWNASPTAWMSDSSGTVGRLYGARTTPHMYVIDPQGVLIYAGAIDDNNSANEEDAKTALNYVSAALDESMGGKKVAITATEPYGCSVKYES